MSIAKIKRSLHNKEKAKAAIQAMISHQFKVADELRKLYLAMTGECIRYGCLPSKPCWECEEEARESKEKATKSEDLP